MDLRSSAPGTAVLLVVLAAAPTASAQPLGMCGDCNGDMSTNILDSLAIAQVAAGLPIVIACAAQPTCNLSAPAGGTVTGDVSWTFGLTDIDGDASTLTFQWSSDGGATFAERALPDNSIACRRAINSSGGLTGLIRCKSDSNIFCSWSVTGKFVW